jgi:hypothetical protein
MAKRGRPKGIPKHTIEQVAEALKANSGFKASAARQLGIGFDAINKRCNNSEILQRIINDFKEQFKDFAESQLLEAIKAGNLTAIIFFLKTQCRDRGYSERVDVVHEHRIEDALEEARKVLAGKRGPKVVAIQRELAGDEVELLH